MAHFASAVFFACTIAASSGRRQVVDVNAAITDVKLDTVASRKIHKGNQDRSSHLVVDSVAHELSQTRSSGWGVKALLGAAAFLGSVEANALTPTTRTSELFAAGQGIEIQKFDTAEYGPMTRAEAVGLCRETIYALGDSVVEIAAASNFYSSVALAGVKVAQGFADREKGETAQSAFNVTKECLDHAGHEGWANLLGTLNIEGGVDAVEGGSRKTVLLGQIQKVGELLAENLEEVAGSAANLGKVEKLGMLGKIGGRLGNFVEKIPHLKLVDEAIKITQPTVNFLKILKQDPTLIRTVLNEDAKKLGRQSKEIAGAVGSFIRGVRPRKMLKDSTIDTGLCNLQRA